MLIMCKHENNEAARAEKNLVRADEKQVISL